MGKDYKKKESAFEAKQKKKIQKQKQIQIVKQKGISKNIQLPNLQKVKQNLIQSLDRKQIDNSDKVKHLERKKENQVNVNQIKVKQYLFETQINEESETKEAKNCEDYKYMKDLNKVIENSDIILEVLDCRDPMNSRCEQAEVQIKQYKDKKLILVLNKIDLVPLKNAEEWLHYYQKVQKIPTIFFKANLQQQNNNLMSNNLYKNSLNSREELANDLLSSSKAVGCEKLLELIKNYSKEGGKTTLVTVGVIGFPNVGKSSLINSMKRNKSCSVSSISGHTKTVQEVNIDSKVKILDSPGIVFNHNKQFIQNAEQIKDPISQIDYILEKISNQTLTERYEITDFESKTKILLQISNRFQKFKKGGIADLEGCARLLIQDFNSGKLKYYTQVPQQLTDIEEETQQETQERMSIE